MLLYPCPSTWMLGWITFLTVNPAPHQLGTKLRPEQSSSRCQQDVGRRMTSASPERAAQAPLRANGHLWSQAAQREAGAALHKVDCTGLRMGLHYGAAGDMLTMREGHRAAIGAPRTTNIDLAQRHAPRHHRLRQAKAAEEAKQLRIRCSAMYVCSNGADNPNYQDVLHPFPFLAAAARSTEVLT